MAYFQAKLAKLEQEITGAGAAVQVDYGTVSSSSPGWVTVPFHFYFSGVPGIAAVQGPHDSYPSNQTLTPPKLAAPTVASPSLSSISVTAPAKPQSWGDQAKSLISSACSYTIGQIPVIGGYLCGGIDGTFGALAKIVFDGIQSLYYLVDMPAWVAAMTKAVEYKVATDWNSWVSAEQQLLNTMASDVNAGLSTLTADAQDAVNSVYGFINEAIGLISGLAMPVAQVRNVTAASFDVYCSGASVPVYYIAIYVKV